MNKIVGIITVIVLGLFLVVEVNHVRADFATGPIGGPITSPITGPISLTPTPTPTVTPTPPCKPGWGYGDKNHCHSGPPGQLKK